MINKNFDILKKVPNYNALKGRIVGKNVLVRVNVNVKNKNGFIHNSPRLNNVFDIIDFLLKENATPVLFGHNGRLDKERRLDKRQSLGAVATYIQGLFQEEKVIFHEASFKKDVGVGLQIRKDDIVKDAINILENVRFEYDFEVGDVLDRKKLALDLLNLSDNKILIFDAFGDLGSKGASIEDVIELSEEVYFGPSMINEFHVLESIISRGFNCLIFGGEKLDKIKFLKGIVRSMRDNGFVLVGSGPSPSLNLNQELLKKLCNGDSEKILTAVDYREPNMKTPLDIGDKTIFKFLDRLDNLKKGVVIYNGTMGLMEDDISMFNGKFDNEILESISKGVFQKGTEAVVKKLIDLNKRGVRIIIIGGDASMAAKKYGLSDQEGVLEFSGGGVPIRIYAGEILTGLKVLAKKLKIEF